MSLVFLGSVFNQNYSFFFSKMFLEKVLAVRLKENQNYTQLKIYTQIPNLSINMSQLSPSMSQCINCNRSLKVFYFPCFSYGECEIFQRNRMERLLSRCRLMGNACDHIRLHAQCDALKTIAVNELILIVLISQQPQ